MARYRCHCGEYMGPHCKHRECRWLRCMREGCRAIFDMKTGRHWFGNNPPEDPKAPQAA